MISIAKAPTLRKELLLNKSFISTRLCSMDLIRILEKIIEGKVLFDYEEIAY